MSNNSSVKVCTKLAFKGSKTHVGKSLNGILFKYHMTKCRFMTSVLTVLLIKIKEANVEKHQAIVFNAKFVK